MSKIECLVFKPHDSGALKGFADFWVPKMGLEIYGCGLFEKGGKRWLSLPSRQVDENGERKYFQIIRFREKGYADGFSKQCMEALDKWIKKNPPKPSQPELSMEPPAEMEPEDLPF